jgi:hypothetical protein
LGPGYLGIRKGTSNTDLILYLLCAFKFYSEYCFTVLDPLLSFLINGPSFPASGQILAVNVNENAKSESRVNETAENSVRQ